jgi:hypothetical protein
LSKDDNQVAGYNPAKDAGQVIGYSHSAMPPKNGGQAAGYSHPTKQPKTVAKWLVISKLLPSSLLAVDSNSTSSMRTVLR